MKILRILLLPFLCFTGCGSIPENATELAATAVGSTIGYEVSDGDPLATAAGGLLGYGAAQFARKDASDKVAQAELRGFTKGMNQAVKQQYWIIQNQQAEIEPVGEEIVRLIPIPQPERTINGVIINPTVEYIRVEP